MNIYFSGLGGVGIGPLAEIALDAGFGVVGSDASTNLMTTHLATRGVATSTDQSGAFLRAAHAEQPIDWFVYTAALPHDHPELVTARQLGLKISKRDELLASIIAQKDMKLIAIAGTHGKTTTTGMMVWTLQQLGVPVSYSIGTTLSWGPSGLYDPESRYFVYECDEFDRNFLHFKPYAAIITTIEHDHVDTYPTEQDYFDAFDQFIGQSEHCVLWQQDFSIDSIKGKNVLVHMVDKTNERTDRQIDSLQIAGRHNRENAYLVLTECLDGHLDEMKVKAALESFPGTNRRFEKLADHLYTDYGHTPTEIKATLQLARELADHVILVYQPHQNVRQHEIRDQYSDAIFADADEVYWLPTYLSREHEELAILTPAELMAPLRTTKVHAAELDDDLWQTIQQARADNKLVLVMGAGSIDGWVRRALSSEA